MKNKMKNVKFILGILLILNVLLGYSQILPQKISDNNQIIKYNGYIISYNESCEQANWVYYVLKPIDFNGEKVKRKNLYKSDPKIKSGTATLKDYKGSGYDRGHLKPSGDEPCDREQMDETFYLSNISPQDPSFNRGIWKKLENYVRSEVLKSDSVVVITGGILSNKLKTIGENSVCVPKHFFKIIHIHKNNSIETLVFVIPNKKIVDIPLYTYKVDIETLEIFSKIKF